MAGFLVNFTQRHDIIVQWDRHLFFKFRHVMASLSTSAKLLTVGLIFSLQELILVWISV